VGWVPFLSTQLYEVITWTSRTAAELANSLEETRSSSTLKVCKRGPKGGGGVCGVELVEEAAFPAAKVER
jgi:hypothetical protein